MEAHGFRRCFTPLPGCFSPFPHGTGPLSVAGECSALEGGPPSFARDSTWPALLRDAPEARMASRTGLSPASAGLPMPFRCPPGLSPRRGPRRPPWRALQPRRGKAAALSPSPVWASARFRSPLLPGSRLISPPPGTEMFQFPGLPPPSLCVQLGVPGHDPWRVPPFGHPRIEGRLRLPGAYRRLPRPSSASCAKASAVRPSYLRSQELDTRAYVPVALRLSFYSWISPSVITHMSCPTSREGDPPGSDSHRCRVDRTLEDERGPMHCLFGGADRHGFTNDLLGQG